MDIKLYGLVLISSLLVCALPINGQLSQGYFSDSHFEGTCPNVTVMQNFNREQFFGSWREVSRIEHEYQRNTDCVILNFEKILNGIAKIQFDSQFLNNQSDFIMNGIAYAIRPSDNEGEFNVVWEADQDSDYDSLIQQFQFRIIETDYTSYAIMYDCTQFNQTHASDFFWVLSRERELAAAAQTRVTAFRQQWNITMGVRDTEQRYSECNSGTTLFISWLLVLGAIGLIKLT